MAILLISREEMEQAMTEYIDKTYGDNFKFDHYEDYIQPTGMVFSEE